jgi:predicted transcriptional regulator
MAITPRKTTAQSKHAARGKRETELPTLTSTTKSATVLALLRSRTGATVSEIAMATGWQNHSVRGFISGTVKKKLGLVVGNEMVDGTRRYRITL